MHGDMVHHTQRRLSPDGGWQSGEIVVLYIGPVIRLEIITQNPIYSMFPLSLETLDWLVCTAELIIGLQSLGEWWRWWGEKSFYFFLLAHTYHSRLVIIPSQPALLIDSS